MVGLFSDSCGDLDAFEAAVELLRAKGAKRFIFAGGRYTDLDEWVLRRRERMRGGRAYAAGDFVADVGSFLQAKDALPVGVVELGSEPEESPTRVRDRFLRTPERDSLQYMDPAIAKKAIEMLGDALCCVVHDKNDLTREDLVNATVFVHGRESEPKVVQIGPRFFVTAGKLTGAAEQTCGLFELVDKKLVYSAFTLDGRAIIDRQSLAVGGRTKLSVK